MNIKDLSGLSKPLTKLIEVVSKGVGNISLPYLIRKKADADSTKIEKIAKAINEATEKNGVSITYRDSDIEVTGSFPPSLIPSQNSIEDRITERQHYQQQRQQENLEKITSAAAQELIAEEVVSDEPVQEEWISRFFDSAKHVSTEELQELWGRVLAGEVIRPGTYSLRILEFLKILDKKNAELIETFSRVTLRTFGKLMFVPIQDKDWLFEKEQIQEGMMFELAELGIMYPSTLRINMFKKDEGRDDYSIIAADHLLLLKRDDRSKIISQPCWKYTRLGVELLELIKPPYNPEFFEKMKTLYESYGLHVKHCHITKHLDNELEYEELSHM